MAIQAFEPAYYGAMLVDLVSSTVSIPGIGTEAKAGPPGGIPPAFTPTVLYIANVGQRPCTVMIGKENVYVIQSWGLLLLPGMAVFIAIGEATHIAAITPAGSQHTTLLNLISGK